MSCSTIYGLRSSKNNSTRAHENGDVESAHGAFKGGGGAAPAAAGQAAASSSRSRHCWAFLETLLAEHNAARRERVAKELAVMRPLPWRRLPAYQVLHGDGLAL